ncbi:MAG: alcohol dehydrogenase catalytic domain-containing protein [Rhodospirillaceae bacterium]|nr:alcohol dehydrogenase catalytic domain-containing protein [Rhodospirillaceae bacterium]
MRAVRLHGVGDIRAETVPAPPPPGPGEAAVRVLAAGICGSDLHNFRTGQWIARTPVIPGHEFMGEVVAVGPAVSGLAPGDRVIADSRVPCGACASCRAGRPNLCERMGYVGEVCDGGFAERVVLKAAGLLPCPPELAPEIAALAEPLGVALRVVRRLQGPANAPVLVAGAGPIGGLAAILLAHLGHGPLLVADRNAARRDLVCALTGAEAIDLDAIDALRTRRIPRMIEATGSAAVLARLVEAVASGGRIVMVGIFHGEATIAPNHLVEREVELMGSSVFIDEQREAVALLPALAPKLAAVVSEPIGLDDVPAAYRRLIEGRADRLKTIIRP